MRDPNRIPEFLDKFGDYWKNKCPDWRFGQLICNLQRFAGNDLFYCEEKKFESLLNDFFNGVEGNKD